MTTLKSSLIGRGALAMLVSLALALGSVGIASADSHGHHSLGGTASHDLHAANFGVASAVSATSVTVTPKGGTATTFTINSSTTFIQGWKTVTAAALGNGDLVYVRTASSTPGVATSIFILPPPSIHAHGVASAVSATSVTVTPSGGTASTFSINAGTAFFQGGQTVTATALANGDFVVVTALASAPTVATSIEIHSPPSVHARGIASAVSATSVTVTPSGGTAVTFSITTTTTVVTGETTTTATVANGDVVEVTALGSAPTVATAIEVENPQSPPGQGGGGQGHHHHGSHHGGHSQRH